MLGSGTTERGGKELLHAVLLIEIYLPSEQSLLHVSSTLVKNSIAFGKPYREYVPDAVYDYLTKRKKHV